MSRAGKFIPGGGGGKAKRTGPIRAPDPNTPPADPNAPPDSPAGKKQFGRGLVKPVPKGLRPPIAIISAIVLCGLVSAGWYFMAYLPAQREKATFEQEIAQMKADIAAQQAADAKKAADDAARQASQRGILTADTNPSGATVVMGDFNGTAPVKFTNITPGSYTLKIHLDGYEDYSQDVTVGGDTPTDVGTIALVQQAGNLYLTSPQQNVSYKITGPDNYEHEGSIPDKLEKLPMGAYTLTPMQGDWTLDPVSITIRDKATTQKEIKFPYANVSITSTPPGATVREGRTVLGQTPLSLSPFRPRDVKDVSVDLPPYTVQVFDLHVPDFGNITKQVALVKDKDFIAACGLPMVWIPDGGFWAAKYDMPQNAFEKVAGYNPSTFRGANRPVETISWEAAMAFVDKLNDYEKKAGKLPNGFHYSLPKESQYEIYNDDANLDLSATSRTTTLTSTQDVGYSAPNKYGLYDTIGNVWEWCLDDYDTNGNHSLRGGCWLSSADHFAGAETRNAGGPKYADQFTGFRVVLAPNQ
jgi:formylglycine-generating enzyme required for sulfatase activity